VEFATANIRRETVVGVSCFELLSCRFLVEATTKSPVDGMSVVKDLNGQNYEKDERYENPVSLNVGIGIDGIVGRILFNFFA
jgi:hypothetical protein